MMIRKKAVIICIILFLFSGFLFAETSPEITAENRPARWAQPLDRPGLPNLHRVSPDFYRSAQPEAKGMAELKKLGIRTVVNLRSHHSDEDMLKGTGINYVSIPINTWKLDEEDAVRFLRIVSDPDKTPILLHCQHGADRTGTMTAVYRIAVSGWTKEEALKEMTEGGFGFHSIWKNLIRFIENTDVKRIREKAGINTLIPPSQTGKYRNAVPKPGSG